MVRDAITGSLVAYGPQAEFMTWLRPCFVKSLFSFVFSLGKSGCGGLKASIIIVEIVSMWRVTDVS